MYPNLHILVDKYLSSIDAKKLPIDCYKNSKIYNFNPTIKDYWINYFSFLFDDFWTVVGANHIIFDIKTVGYTAKSINEQIQKAIRNQMKTNEYNKLVKKFMDLDAKAKEGNKSAEKRYNEILKLLEDDSPPSSKPTE